MRSVDLLRLAWKTLRCGRTALPAALCAVAVFCGCFAGAISQQIALEQALPCELAVTAANQAAISDAVMDKARQIPEVLGTTTILEMPVTVTTGVYSAQLTLTGIDGTYLAGEFRDGFVFPADSAMPYLVLNDAACRKFQQTSDTGNESGGAQQDQTDAQTVDAAPAIDWLKAGFVLKTGDARPVVAKVCGIFAQQQKGEPAAAYVSLASLRALLHAAGQDAAMRAARVRVVNVGEAHAVSLALAALGLQAADSNAAQQARWDERARELHYLLTIGIVALLAAVGLTSQGRQLLLAEQRPAWQALQLMGLRRGQLRGMLCMQGLIVALSGAAVGILVSLLLPSFLADAATESVFLLNAPAWAAATAGSSCSVAGLISGVLSKIQQYPLDR